MLDSVSCMHTMSLLRVMAVLACLTVSAAAAALGLSLLEH